MKSNCEDYPHCEYIGKSKRRFKDRLSEHRDYVKRDVTSEPSGGHFSKRGHDVSHLKGLVLEQVRNSDPFILKTREHLLIQKFDTFRTSLTSQHYWRGYLHTGCLRKRGAAGDWSEQAYDDLFNVIENDQVDPVIY